VPQKPLFRDFIGLNVHTVQFRPALYRPVTRLVRDYHGFNWDVGDDTDYAPQFPFARNRVDWGELYGAWRKAGYRIDVSVMFGGTPQSAWKDPARDAHNYGRAFARFFGSSVGRDLAESVEIGNEPGHYEDAFYRTVFENMARGLRAGDARLKIATCATAVGKSGPYHKSLSVFEGLERLVRRHQPAHVRAGGGLPDVAPELSRGPGDPVPEGGPRRDRVAQRPRAGQAGLDHRVRLGRLDKTRAGRGDLQ
jgi:serine/threonine-protein kinase ATR